MSFDAGDHAVNTDRATPIMMLNCLMIDRICIGKTSLHDVGWGGQVGVDHRPMPIKKPAEVKPSAGVK